MAASMTHICPIPGCDQHVHREVLMCSEHWLIVPKSMRRLVCTTWHALERTLGPREEVRRRFVAYREARAAAVRVVADALSPVT